MQRLVPPLQHVNWQACSPTTPHKSLQIVVHGSALASSVFKENAAGIEINNTVPVI